MRISTDLGLVVSNVSLDSEVGWETEAGIQGQGLMGSQGKKAKKTQGSCWTITT